MTPRGIRLGRMLEVCRGPRAILRGGKVIAVFSVFYYSGEPEKERIGEMKEKLEALLLHYKLQEAVNAAV